MYVEISFWYEKISYLQTPVEQDYGCDLRKLRRVLFAVW